MSYVFFLLITSTLSLCAMVEDAKTFINRQGHEHTLKGAYGNDYAELGKRLPLFNFHFIGGAQEDNERYVAYAINNAGENIFCCWKENKLRYLRVNDHAYLGAPLGGWWYDRVVLKITRLYLLILQLEQNPERKKRFLDFHKDYFEKTNEYYPIDMQLEDFIESFEQDPAKKSFLWKLHQKPFHDLGFDQQGAQLYPKIMEKIAKRIKP